MQPVLGLSLLQGACRCVSAHPKGTDRIASMHRAVATCAPAAVLAVSAGRVAEHEEPALGEGAARGLTAVPRHAVAGATPARRRADARQVGAVSVDTDACGVTCINCAHRGGQ